MGRVRNKVVKRSARQIVEKYYQRLTMDFQTNKRSCDDVAIIPSKRLKNKIAGFVTHLMKRIQRGPVRGISLKLQEEERERRLDFIPDQSSVDCDNIPIDPETKAMLRSLDMHNLPGLSAEVAPVGGNRDAGRDGERRGYQGDPNKPRPERR
ncbi:ribosomal S17-domain-containing protein [Pavlovales sp. CCMP2436]|nr:ribosomal S17-domain-containing protein [Pavlovales sp. CCMP2436]